jgi:coenzyme F420 biosynthesis associated uncharacterized protein
MNRSSDLRRLGTLLLLGVAAGYGVRYVAAKVTARGPQSLADWDFARTIALRVSESYEHPVRDRAARQAQYQRLVAQSEPLIARYMGADLAPIQRIYVFDRREWLEANMLSFKQIMEPVENLYQEASQANGGAGSLAALLHVANRPVVGVQLGVLLGYLARRVLGQYDLSLLSPDPSQRGALYFVEPNIARAQQLLGVSDEEFRLWIALHETSHVFQFEAFPWVRSYFQDLVRQFVGQVTDQIGVTNDLGALIDRVREGRAQGKHWIEIMLSPQQQQIFDRLQSLMSLIEGYSNHIMNAIGRDLLPSFHDIEQRVQQRQLNRPLIEEVINRVTGMDLKLAQYRQGEQFIDAVVAQRGILFANRVWEGPENLPTMDELRDPVRWIARIEG